MEQADRQRTSITEVSAPGAENPSARIGALAHGWLESLSPEFAADVIQNMERVESWRVDRVPGPWVNLFKWLVQERRDGRLDQEDLGALINYLAYLGSANALFLMARALTPDGAFEALLSHAAERAESAPEEGDPMARVMLARVRRLFLRRFYGRVFGPERRAEVLEILWRQRPLTALAVEENV